MTPCPATIRPIETAARLLVGSSAPLPTIVDAGQLRDLDLAIEVPDDELGAVCTNEQWDELYGRLAQLGSEHRSTLIFVNTRRLVERVAFHLGERLGEDVVAAHHGSLSRARRFEAERRLKAGASAAPATPSRARRKAAFSRSRAISSSSAAPSSAPPAGA